MVHAKVMRWLAQAPYVVATELRNHYFDTWPGAVRHVPLPVVSVGNLSVGGTGKTPFVALLAEWSRQAGLRPAILSRGYGAVAGRDNDEMKELRQRVPFASQVANPDRIAGALKILASNAADLILLDDGFQHRRLHRDLDIVLLDALRAGQIADLLPTGRSRECPSQLRRADVVVLTRSDAVSAAGREDARTKIQELAPNALWCEAVERPVHFVSTTGGVRSLQEVKPLPLAAFCGIGNPEGFWHTLRRAGMNVVATKVFPDHHPYRPHDLVQLRDWVQRHAEVSAVVCTRKDQVKLTCDSVGDRPLLALEMQTEIVTGRSDLLDRFTVTVRSTTCQRRSG